MSKRRAAAVLSTAVALALSGCGVSLRAQQNNTPTVSGPSAGQAGGSTPASTTPATFGPGSLVGVLLPGQSADRWSRVARLLRDDLAEAGFAVDVRYASSAGSLGGAEDPVTGLIGRGAKVLVVVPDSDGQVTGRLDSARAAGATVISLGSLVKDTPHVDYFVGFDERKVGQLQAQALLQGLNRRKPGGPYTVEVFPGSQTDEAGQARLAGVMDILQPEITGTPGQVRLGSGGIGGGPSQSAPVGSAGVRARMAELLTSTYARSEVDGVLVPDDEAARQVIGVFIAAGRAIPVVVGQAADPASLSRIRQGLQYATVHQDGAELAEQVAKVTSDLAQRGTASVNDSRSGSNGAKVVPSILVAPDLVTKETVDSIDGLGGGPSGGGAESPSGSAGPSGGPPSTSEGPGASSSGGQTDIPNQSPGGSPGSVPAGPSATP